MPRTLTREGRSERAFAIAREIIDDQDRAKAFNSLASILLKSGRKAEASQAATEVLTAVNEIKKPDSRARLRAEIATILNDLGRTNEAKEAADWAHKDASEIQGRSIQFEQATLVLRHAMARIGDYYSALQAASACRFSADKLTAYTAIMLEYYRRRNPGLAKLLEEEERDEVVEEEMEGAGVVTRSKKN